jgi:hypothetical protein
MEFPSGALTTSRKAAFKEGFLGFSIHPLQLLVLATPALHGCLASSSGAITLIKVMSLYIQ